MAAPAILADGATVRSMPSCTGKVTGSASGLMMVMTPIITHRATLVASMQLRNAPGITRRKIP